MLDQDRVPPAEAVSVAEAKTRFSELLRRVEAGETFLITRHGRTVARLQADPRSGPKTSILGAMKGEIWMAPDFDDLGPEWDEYVK